MFGELASVLVGIAILIGIFWLCRELFCWYWKFNRMVELAELQRLELIAIKGLLKKLVAQGEARAEDGESTVEAPTT